MMNSETLKDAIRKLVENLFLRSLNKNEYKLFFYPNFDNKPALSLEIDVDLEKINPNHPKYDSEYTNAVFDMGDIPEKIKKYLGLSYNNIQIFTAPNYTNEQYIWGEIDFVRDSIKKHLLNKGYSREEINNLEIWVNLYTREEDTPHIHLEVGTEVTPLSDNLSEEIEDSSFEALRKTKFLESLVYGDIEFFHDYV